MHLINPKDHEIYQGDIATACKILVALKLDSGPFGNVSIRLPGTDRFWVNPNGITFDQLRPEDNVLTDIDGQIHQGHLQPHPGTFIHKEIYRLREDVMAIVHTHSDNTVAMSLLGCTIEPFTQLGAAIFADQGLYQGFTGPVRDSNEGRAIAEALGNKTIVIAKNHGLFATGLSLQAALWDMVVADMAAKIHLTARQLGLHHADQLPEAFLLKSKIEVREKQNQFMWESYRKRLHNK